MADTGWLFAGTIVNDATGGGTAWGTPTNAASNNNIYTSVALAASAISQHLKATNFSIPDLTGSTINKVIARFQLRVGSGGPVTFDVVSLVIGGTIQGVDKATGSVPSSEQDVDFGDADADTYWETDIEPATFTSTFGVAMRVRNGSNFSIISVDSVALLIDYTPASTATLEVKQSGVEVTTLDFGTTPAGTAVQQTVQLHAVGGDVEISDITVPAGYSIVSEPTTIAEDDSEDLVLQLDADIGGTNAGDVDITSDADPVSFGVTGEVTSTVFCYVANDNTPFVTGYHFGGGNFGEKLAAPGTPATGDGQRIRFSPNGRFVGMVHATSPFVTIHHFDPITETIGSKVSDPPTAIPGTGRGIAWNPDGTLIAIAHSSSPFVSVFAWSSSGFGAKLTNPTTLPASTGFDVSFSPDGRYLVVAHTNSPFVSAYPISASGFGTKLSNPATLPAGNGTGVCFSRDGSQVFVTHVTTPGVSGYPWSNGFGAKYSDPATPPTGNGQDVAVSPDNQYLAVAHVTSPRISVYLISGSGFGAKVTDPSSLPAGNGRGVAWSPTGDSLTVACDGTPFVIGWEWSAGFGDKLDDPASLPGGDAMGVCFSPRFQFKPWFVQRPQVIGA